MDGWKPGLYRNLTPRQRELIEEFGREEQGEYDKRAAAGASGWRRETGMALIFDNQSLVILGDREEVWIKRKKKGLLVVIN